MPGWLRALSAAGALTASEAEAAGAPGGGGRGRRRGTGGAAKGGGAGLTVWVRREPREPVPIDVAGDASVAELRKAAEAALDAKLGTLTFGGRALVDAELLADVGIGAEAVVDAGGMTPISWYRGLDSEVKRYEGGDAGMHGVDEDATAGGSHSQGTLYATRLAASWVITVVESAVAPGQGTFYMGVSDRGPQPADIDTDKVEGWGELALAIVGYNGGLQHSGRSIPTSELLASGQTCLPPPREGDRYVFNVTDDGPRHMLECRMYEQGGTSDDPKLRGSISYHLPGSAVWDGLVLPAAQWNGNNSVLRVHATS